MKLADKTLTFDPSIGGGLTWDNGVLSGLPLGGISAGNGLELTGNTLSATPYVLPTATKTIKGGIKIGEGVKMTGASSEYLNFLLDTVPSTTEGAMWLSVI